MDVAKVIVDPRRDLLAMAPTGSGKTAVALMAILQAFARGKKAIYTSPIKALSNQKYAHAFLLPTRFKLMLLHACKSVFGRLLGARPLRCCANNGMVERPLLIPFPCTRFLWCRYAEFKEWFRGRGVAAEVSLLTGDVKIRAPPGTRNELIICTSEILRNKLVKVRSRKQQLLPGVWHARA